MPSPAELRVGIVGLGKMGVLHSVLVNADPGARIVAACDTQKMVRILAGKALRNVAIYKGHEEMLEREELDAVFVTTPIRTHIEIIKDILRARSIHVFVEKPLAANAKDAEELSELVAPLGIATGVGYQKRFSETFRAGKRVLDGGVLGTIQSYDGYTFSSDIFVKAKGWRFTKGSGGALLDLGCHLVDLVLWYFGEPSKVTGSTESWHSTEVDDYVKAHLSHGEAYDGNLEVSWSMPDYRLPETALNIKGTDGEMKVTDDYIQVEMTRPTNVLLPGTDLGPGLHTFYQQDFKEPVSFLYGEAEYGRQDEAFLKAAIGDSEYGPSFERAVAVNRVVDAIYRNAHDGE